MRAIDPDNIPNVWRGIAGNARARAPVVPTGYAALDDALAGGWPTGELIELLTQHDGIGELGLLLPLMRALKQECSENIVLWINVPHELNAVALIQHGREPASHWYARNLNDRDAAYCIEAGVRSRACAMIVGWLPRTSTTQLRRIKLGCAETRTICVLFRPNAVRACPSPAGLRAALATHDSHLRIEVFKQRALQPRVVDVSLQPSSDRAHVL